MEGIPLPVIPVGDLEGTGLVILPDLDMDKLDTVSFEVNKDILQVTCFFKADAEDDQQEYPVKITDSNREIISSMDKLAVMNADQIEPEKLASHPEEQDKLENLMNHIQSGSGFTPLDMMSTNGEEDRGKE